MHKTSWALPILDYTVNRTPLVLCTLLITLTQLHAQTFTSTGSMNEPRQDHAAVLLTSGKVLVTGGYPSIGTAEIYDPAMGTWRYTLHPMTTQRWYHTSTLLADGRVLIVGGANASAGRLFSGEIFDPTTEQFTSVHPPSYPHALQPAVLLKDGRVLLIGGDLGSEIYDPVLDTWTPTPSFLVGDREFPAIALFDGTVVAFGGDINNPGCCVTSVVDKYDPLANSAAPLAGMLTARVDHTSTLLPSGQAVIAGGAGYQDLNSTEVYDPSIPGGQSQSGNSLNFARRHHRDILLPTGDVLVIGGYQANAGFTPLATSELRDHTTGLWSLVGTMSTARNGHTATLLPSGAVLVAGGGPGSPTNTTELWNGPAPSLGTIQVTTNLPSASFTITGPATYNGSGTSFTQPGAPVGTYTVVYHDVPQYITPATQTGTLTAGQTTQLVPQAFYTPITLSACPVNSPSCPQSLSFAYEQGSGNGNATQQVSVIANAPVFFTVSVSTDPVDGPWLTSSTPSGWTPTMLTVSVSSNLSVGTHTGKIIISAAQAINSPQVLLVTVVVSHGPPPVISVVREFRIATGPADEPSIAADPTRPLHAVVGFNDTSGCGWAETDSGGVLWQRGSLTLTNGFHAISDPWVRYSPDGQLFYSCMGKNDTVGSNAIGVFLATSPTGRARDLQPAVPIVTGAPGILNISENTDHPAIAVLQLATGTRIVACWVDFFQSGNKFLYTAYSPDGKTWFNTQVLGGPKAGSCILGGTSSEIALAWHETIEKADGSTNDILRIRTSNDGVNWTDAAKLGDVGQLVFPNTDGSTTVRVLSEPYAVTTNTSRGLRALWEARQAARSQLFYADEADGWLPHQISTGFEDFLPAAGDCDRLIGAYEAVARSASLFRYKVWSQDETGILGNVFTSGADLDGQYGAFAGDHILRTIGDYTGISCAGNVGWAVWTDVRTPPNHLREIWGVRLSLPQELGDQTPMMPLPQAAQQH